MKSKSRLAILCSLSVVAVCAADSRPDILIADFEAPTYGDWQSEGEAFGPGPAQGTLPGQMQVSGFKGKRLVNSFFHGDRTTGRLTSPKFRIERPWLNFFVGGGGYADVTCMNLLVDGRVVRTATGPNTRPGGSEELEDASWDVEEFVGRMAVIQIVDQRTGGWGHINVDHIVQSDAKAAPTKVELAKILTVNSSHLIVPVANRGERVLLGLFDGGRLVQSFAVALPRDGEPHWLAAYPLAPFDLDGKAIRIASADGRKMPESLKGAFEFIRVGPADEALGADDYAQPYRDQVHVTTRRGWNNDPNGMVFHEGKYHLYYQHNPFGIGWGNMHWGHFVSTDLVHWEEQPITLFQKTTRDMMFSGGGFVDFHNSAGLGKGVLFVAFTSTGRGECLAYSRDGGMTFTELPENPVVKHKGRDPKIVWYAPGKKWVMAVFNDEDCAETKATPPAKGMERLRERNIAFHESTDLRKWQRTGAFTDADRDAVFECPELFELPVTGRPGESRWILYGAQNRYFIGRFDGKTFVKESGPHGASRGSLYAAQTFSDTPDGRRIQIGWIRTTPFLGQFPDQMVSQSFSLPQELALRESKDGLRVFMTPVKEVGRLRGKLLSEDSSGLGVCAGEVCEVLVEFAKSGTHELLLNGIRVKFTGRSARIFVDRTVCEVYVDGGREYFATRREPAAFGSRESQIVRGSEVRSLKVYRLKSIW